MATNIYAKHYTVESKARKTVKYALISYTSDPNTYSIVNYERLLEVNALNKAWICENDKMYRVSVDKTGNCVEHLEESLSFR